MSEPAANDPLADFATFRNIRWMLRLSSIIPLVLLQSSCADDRDENARMASAIDAALTLPDGAAPIDSYARYYSVRPDGKIQATYVVAASEDAPKPADYGCTEITSDDQLKDIPCPADDSPRAGDQRWVNSDEIPIVDDGGCLIINILYDPSSNRVEAADCNGSL